MSKKLTREQLENKVKFHEKKAIYYEKKINQIDKKAQRIGFIHYD